MPDEKGEVVGAVIVDSKGKTIGGAFTNLWTVRLSDWERGLVIAFFSAPMGILYDWATIDNFSFTWKALLRGAVAGFLAYIGKNFITGSGGKILSNSQPIEPTGK